MSQLTAKVPVGFRFHPTDEELVGYYLPKKVGAMKIDLDLIRDLDLYKLEPWDLQELCKIQADSNEKQTDYYFFSRKDRKYPTGNRANRATTKGFWKATGRDKPIHTKLQTVIGMRKTLVFYQGRAPHGVKTDWIMHEFRLDDGPGRPAHEDGGWVVCRVFKKNKNLKMKMMERATVSYEEAQMGLLPEAIGSPEILSGGGRFAYPDPSGSHFGSVKRELINLDEYQTVNHGNQHLSSLQREFGLSTKVEQHVSMPPTSEQIRSYLTRTLSLKRPEDVNSYLNSYQEGASLCEYNDPQSSGSDGNDGNADSPLSGLENVDWNSLLQEPIARSETPAVMGGDRDMTILLQLKRQNSDIFSSLDLWNYSQVAQQM
ncbi:hypothetical protein M758_4G093600 [Ceratodon purpureus]|uniref:NAC domain-containing protein n=1 Tax=Ceratodon purpureus TaxID=3225 RepID=A0A8T0I8K0_CERPU|nr:hypothetical protein KC19_4G093000 [Ceratodon purpureus]KAG0618818.1 hypothetical protein M758_4G093600 [Ceratodon purpureus]